MELSDTSGSPAHFNSAHSVIAQRIVLYLGDALQQEDLMSRLGKYKTGKGCLYIKTQDDVDRSVLIKLIEKSVAEMRKRSL